MKIRKPLMVKLSASLLVACGVVLPALGATGWTSTPEGNWILTGTSNQTSQVVVGSGSMATLSSGSQWSKFDPTSVLPPAAIYFEGEGTLNMNGGRLGVAASLLDTDVRGVFGEGTLTVASWATASTLTVVNAAGDATGIEADELNIGVPPVILPGDPDYLLPRVVNVLAGAVTVTAANDAYGVYADYDLNVWGNLNGAVTVAGGNDAYGLMSDSGDLLVSGAFSGKITATSTGASGDYGAAYAIYSHGNIDIFDVFSGTVTVTAKAIDGDAYGLYAENDQESFGIRIGGNFTGKITATANLSDSGQAYGMYADYYGDIDIGGALSGTVTATGHDATALYADDDIYIKGKLSGVVTATATDDAYGLDADEGIYINSDVSGTVTAKSTNGDAYGLYAYDYDIWIGGNLSGKVIATSSLTEGEGDVAGLYSGDGDISIDGALSGSVTVTGYDATGLYACDDIMIGGKLSGVVIATATDDAYALDADYGIYIDSDLSGKVTVKGEYAYGLSADYIYIGDAEEAMVGNLTGTVAITGGYRAYGLDAYDGIYINGNLSGTVTATTTDSDGHAAGLYVDGSSNVAPPAPGFAYNNYGTIDIVGNLSGRVTVIGGAEAYGLYAGNSLRIGKDLSGTIKVSTIGIDRRDSAVALFGGEYYYDYGANGVYVGGNLSGSITAVSAGGSAIGITGYNIGMYGNLAGSVTATGGWRAVGLMAQNDLQINGNLTGKITAKSTSTTWEELVWDEILQENVLQTFQLPAFACGLAAYSDLSIYGNVAGTVVVSATPTDVSPDSEAVGFGAFDNLLIGGNLSGQITVSADVAAGMFAGDYSLNAPTAPASAMLPGNGDSMLLIAKDFSGKVTVTASSVGFGMVSMGDLNIVGKPSGTITVTAAGAAYGMGAADTVLLGSAYTVDAPAPTAPLPVAADVTGTITVTGGYEAYGLFAGDISEDMYGLMSQNGWFIDGNPMVGTIAIAGSLSGKVTATAGYMAGAVAANNSIWIGRDLSGKITATATALDHESIAAGVWARNDLVINGRLSGTVSASASWLSTGLSADNILIGNGLSGKVTATGGVFSAGLVAGQNGFYDVSPPAGAVPSDGYGDVFIEGALSGSVTVSGTGDYGAYGLAADNDLIITGPLSGSVTVTGSTGHAYGLYADDDLDIGSITGKITVKGDDRSAALYSDYIVDIGGLVSGTLQVTSTTDDAYGIYAYDDVYVRDDISGKITVTAGSYAAGLYSDYDEMELSGDISGSIIVTGGSSADGIYAGCDMWIGGNVSGTITATAGDNAYGLYSEGDIDIDGSLSGTVTATSTGMVAGDNEAFALYADSDLTIGGALSGKITAVSAYGHAGGLYAYDSIDIFGGITKTAVISATGRTATAIEAYAGDIDDGDGGTLLIAGTVKAIGQESAIAIQAGGTMNLKITGTVSATLSTPPASPSGLAAPAPAPQAYAILSTAEMADDTIELGSGAKLVGAIDLGGNTEIGDTFTVTGRGSYDGSISGIETLVVNADNTGWQLGGLNSNGNFNAIALNTGVFGFGTSQIVHITTNSFIQQAASTVVIKFKDDDCDNITVNPGGIVQVSGKVKFVPFGQVTTQGIAHEWLTLARAPLGAAPATEDSSSTGTPDVAVGEPADTSEPPAIPVFEVEDSIVIDSKVTSSIDTDGTVRYFVMAARQSIAEKTIPAALSSLARALDKCPTSDVFTLMDGVSAAALPSALAQLQPVTATTHAVLSGSHSFSNGVGLHLGAIRQGMTMASRPVNARMPSLAATGDNLIGETLQAARAAVSETTEWQVSGRYMNDTGRLESDGTAAGNQWKTNGFMVNLDRQINSNLMIGAAAGGSWSYIDISRDSGNVDATSLNSRLYAAWFEGPWHVNGQIGYGRNWMESKRYIAFGADTAKAKWNSDVYAISLGGGYDVDLSDGWVLEPNATIDYTRVQDESYSEHDSIANLSVDANNYDSLRHQIGLALRRGFTLDASMVLRPEVRLTWAHEYLDSQVRSSASLFGQSFTTQGVKQSRDSAIIGLGMNMQFNETIGGYLSYDAELSSDKMSQGVSVGIRFNF